MSEKIKALIIDDEPHARLLIKSYLASSDAIELIGECSDGFEGAMKIKQLEPDLIFLDVQMPKLNGFEMLELLEKIPLVVFSTAYDEFALRAFEFGAVDYLLKPFNQSRFEKAIQKALAKSSEGNTQDLHNMVEFVRDEQEIINRIAVKKNNGFSILNTSTIQHFEAQDDYVFIFTDSGERFMKNLTMKYLEDHLDGHDFIRVHRSHIIRMDQINKIELWEKDSHLLTLKSGKTVPVSKSGYKKLKDTLKL